MKLLVTFPGRAGDLLWALPTVRAIADVHGCPCDLQIAGEFASMLDLLRLQPYLGHVSANPHWGLSEADNWQAPMPVGTPEGTYEHVVHLGYRRWPERPLPHEAYLNALDHFAGHVLLPPLDLARPWITVEGPGAPCDVAVGFTEAWFELKLGLLISVTNRCHNRTLLQLTPHGTRWRSQETAGVVSVMACDWLEAARAIRNSDVVLADCSALHVLAVAMGKPVVVLEPMEARLASIFWPLGQNGPQVTLVRGNDGQATFDARHCAETLEAVLHGR